MIKVPSFLGHTAHFAGAKASRPAGPRFGATQSESPIRIDGPVDIHFHDDNGEHVAGFTLKLDA